MQTGLAADLRRYPALWSVLIAALVCFPFVVSLADNQISALARWLLVVDVTRAGSVDIARLLEEMEPWRWFTPALIHFSLMHLVFNGLLAVLFGRPVEAALGHTGCMALLLWLMLAGNLTQVAFSATPYFGGLSGMVYGLVGYVAVMQRLQPASPLWHLPPGLIPSLLAFLVLFSTGITEYFGLHIANAAHWGGLAAGVAAALLIGLVWQKR